MARTLTAIDIPWEDEHHRLWSALQTFELDAPGAALSFSDRLARENRWSREFGQRAILEYRRFLFLCMAARHECTPSDEVDQVWHLHLLYTRSYWERLCGEVLRRPLHHGPTKGGTGDGRRFWEQYQKTLTSYRLWFGEQAPPDIWPRAEVRFGRATGYARVHLGDFWFVPRLRWRGWRWWQT